MKLLVVMTMLAVLSLCSVPLVYTASAQAEKVEFKALPKPGDKVSLDARHYFTFEFEKQPKLGNAIMKVEVFTLDGKRDKSFVVMGDLDMPSMRGAHSSGSKKFALSTKGLYLLPVQLVMPGDWEFRFTFEKKGNVVFRGAYYFGL